MFANYTVVNATHIFFRIVVVLVVQRSRAESLVPFSNLLARPATNRIDTS